MRNENPRNMWKTQAGLAVIAVMDEPYMLKNIVEELAGQRLQRLEATEGLVGTSTIEAHVSGTIGLADQKDIAHMPFVTCFLFTCVKIGGANNHLTWASSLS